MSHNTWTQIARLVSRPDEPAAKPVQDEVVALFGELRSPLLRYLHSLGLPAGDGEDIAQDAFIALFRHLCEGKPRDNLRAWVFRVARNLALKRIQQAGASAEVSSDAIAAAVDPSANPEQRVVSSQQERAVRGVIAALSAMDRQCLQLRAEGLRYREIATVLDISLGAVAASLSRTLTKVARATQPENRVNKAPSAGI